MLKKISNLLFSEIKMIFYEYPYNSVMVWHEPPDGFIFRALQPSDHDALSEMLTAQRDAETVFFKPIDIGEAAARLDRGEVCYICERAGRIIGYCWFAPGARYISQIDSTICLKATDVYLYNGYVLKEYRRHSITEGNINAARRDLVPRGFTREIVATMAWNKPSQRFLSKFGYNMLGMVRAGYFLTFRYMINTCRGVSFISDVGPLDFYRRFFRKLSAAVSRVRTAARMWVV